MNIKLINKTITIIDAKTFVLREQDLVNLSLKTDYILLEVNQMGTPQEFRIYSSDVILPTHSTLAGLFTILSNWYSIVKNETFLDREIIGTTRTLVDTEVMNTIISNYGQGEANINMTLPTPAQGYKFVVQVTEPSANYFRITSTGNIIVDGVQADYASFATPKQGDYFKVFTEKIIPTADNFITAPKLTMSTSAHVKAHSTAFSYYLSGVKYSVAAGDLLLGTDTIPKGKFGAVAIDIDSTGVSTPISAPDNATGYNTAALAIAGLPAAGAGFLRLGYVTASGKNETGGADFTFSDTALDAAHTLVTIVTLGTTYVPTYKYIVTTGQAANKNYVTDAELALLVGTGATEGAYLKIVGGVPTWVLPS
jgi:hypothetical protein